MGERTLRFLIATITAAPLLGQPTAQATEPLKVHYISASDEYKSEEALATWQKHLAAPHNVAFTVSRARDKGAELPGLDALEMADVLVVFSRRITLPPDQLAELKKWCQSGKPVLGIRTASHAFQNWPEFDKEILGGNYQGHYPALTAQVKPAEDAKNHPILARIQPFASEGNKLYKNPNLPSDSELLLIATADGRTEPAAWTRTQNGGRVFYTALGTPADFANEQFLTLLTNALYWVANRTPQSQDAAQN